MLTWMILVLSLLGFQAADPAAGNSSCLYYDPAVVHLTGTVVERTVPGPPKYTSIANGDLAEPQTVLILDHPICTAAQAGKTSLYSQTERDQKELTVTPDPNIRFERFRGARVRVEGTLAHATNPHEHTPLILTVTRIDAVTAERPR